MTVRRPAERSILFSTPMVRAILAGTKTQTRRIVKHRITGPNPPGAFYDWRDAHTNKWLGAHGGVMAFAKCNAAALCPYGKPGDLLWVRESFAIVPRTAYARSDGVRQTLRPDDGEDAAIYRADWVRSAGGLRWRPSIHMPRWASRITLEITDVRVERLQAIGRDDAIAEGVEWNRCPTHQTQRSMEAQIAANRIGMAAHWEGEIDYVGGYRWLWESIHGENAWVLNPWVWVIEFRRL